VDKGRCPHVEDARAREDEDNGDRTEAEAECESYVSESCGTWRAAGTKSEEEKGVNVREGALADLDGIFAYIAADNREAAGRLVGSN
jgi:hypothetical protein